MGLPLLRRRSTPDTNQLLENPNPTTSSKKGLPSLPPLFLLLIVITLWFSALLLSSSFHLCIYSRKLQSYCITGGIEPRLDSLNTLLNRPIQQNLTILDTDNSVINNNVIHTDHPVINNVKEVEDNRTAELINAITEAKAQMENLRSWASQRSSSSCEGRGIFVYDLPPKFNKDLMGFCGDFLPWSNLCDFFSNQGMGKPIPELGNGWHHTHQYSLEPIFHLKVSNHPCRVYNPDEAKLFYVPFYGGLHILRWHFKNNVSDHVKDALGIELVQWLETQESWARNGGRDHMFVLGKISWDFRRKWSNSWGSNFLSLEAMQNPYKFMIERQPWEIKEIGIPHPTHFHPHSDDDIATWQTRIISSDRRSLVSFAGAARPEAVENIRSVLIKQCVANNECRFLDCASGSCENPAELVNLFAESEFCMQPPGDSPTRKSVFDSLVSGCIPVLFDPYTAYYQYPWHLPEDHRKYSVFLDQEEVREGKVDVIERLKMVPLKEREEMRRYIVYQLMPGLVYGDADAKFVRFRDAFGVVVDSMLDRVTGPN